MSPAKPSLVDREDLRRRIDTRLCDVLDEQTSILTKVSDDAAPLVGAWRQMLLGGKRLRAAFCYWSWRAHGGTAPHSAPGTAHEAGGTLASGGNHVIAVGAALELFQAAALFHDDVIDRSDTRRGVPTAHRAFARMHHDSGWQGDADQFGLSAAILLGDLSLIASEDEFLRAVRALPHERARTALSMFSQMRTEVTVGQYLDVHAEMLPWGTDFEADERRSREIIRAKSARYSVEYPLLIGAVLAGASDTQRAASSAFGLPLGEAFQLRDDLLGVFGDPAATGKPVGDDLREGKRTILMVRTMRALNPAQRREFASHLGRADLTAQEIVNMQSIVRGSGAVDEVEALIAELSTHAFEALTDSQLDTDSAATLLDLARAAVQRAA
jgi:geranylgeranyl diphosphate synthase, type I